jgi:hypothetical protein
MPLDRDEHKRPFAAPKTATHLLTKGQRLLSAALTISCIAFSITPAPAQTTPAPKSSFAKATGKKLIELGWDQFYAPDPAFIRDNIREMEKRPFEGIAFRLPPEDSNVFHLKDWRENKAEQKKQLEVLSSIKWDKFTNNFLTIYAASDMDWFSDEDWKTVLAKVQFNARAARTAGCVGIVFDPEPYGSDPWIYTRQKHTAQYNFDAYSQKAYERGQQFMRVMEKEMPAVKLLMLYQYSWFYYNTHDPDPAKRATIMRDDIYGLMLPFLNGMLSVAGPKVQFIDGNEKAYGYTNANEYYRAYWNMRQGSRINLPDALKNKFDAQVRAGNALYADYVFATGTTPAAFKGMTPDDRARWFEQNVYYALKTSDEYVWLWSEAMDWFNHPVLPGDYSRLKEWKSKPIPPGMEDAIVSAKAKLQNGDNLGFSMDAKFQEIRTKLKQELIQRSAVIPRLKQEQTPRLDGVLDEKIYQELPWQENFVPNSLAIQGQGLVGATSTFTAYDDQNLYIAFRCNEPNMKGQEVSGSTRDSSVYAGESVEIFVLQPGQPVDDLDAVFYHLILNPNNAQWDALNTGTFHSSSFDLDWKSATAKHADSWTVEVAIPWKELGITRIEPGLKIHGNLTRQRRNENNGEISSWSQVISGFQEPQHFGTWTLGQ